MYLLRITICRVYPLLYMFISRIYLINYEVGWVVIWFEDDLFYEKLSAFGNYDHERFLTFYNFKATTEPLCCIKVRMHKSIACLWSSTTWEDDAIYIYIKSSTPVAGSCKRRKLKALANCLPSEACDEFENTSRMT
jgi:hypothetical protein